MPRRVMDGCRGKRRRKSGRVQMGEGRRRFGYVKLIVVAAETVEKEMSVDLERRKEDN